MAYEIAYLNKKISNKCMQYQSRLIVEIKCILIIVSDNSLGMMKASKLINLRS